MKSTHKLFTALSAVMTIHSAQAAVIATADFEGSTAGTPTDGVATSAANLNLGSTGGTWSAISATGTNSAVEVTTGNVLRFGVLAGVNSTQTSTATFNLNSAATLSGASISFDYVQLGGGGQPGNVFVDVYNGSTHVLRISGSPDAGGGRRTLSHWDSVGGTRTALASEDVFGATETINVTFSLSTSDFGVATTGASNASGNFNSTGLAYINSGQTTFDKIVFTAVDNKAVATFDNLSIDVVPEPSSTALLGLGGLALILRRKK